MKEATGEATNTVVTIILIAAVLTMGGVIVRAVMQKISDRATDTADSSSRSNIYYKSYYRFSFNTFCFYNRNSIIL